jgi:hypothetical protein
MEQLENKILKVLRSTLGKHVNMKSFELCCDGSLTVDFSHWQRLTEEDKTDIMIMGLHELNLSIWEESGVCAGVRRLKLVPTNSTYLIGYVLIYKLRRFFKRLFRIK